jgi:heme oxygenase-like protein
MPTRMASWKPPKSGAVMPSPRGPLSVTVLSALGQKPGWLREVPVIPTTDALADDDFQLALYLCYELHYRDMAGVDSAWEWDPGLLGFRAALEGAFLKRLRDETGNLDRETPGDVGAALTALIADSSGPSLSAFLLESGTLEQLREFCIHRSSYQLKEADPHTFAIARLEGECKATMVEIQRDEYGSGEAAEMHSTLFANTMAALNLDARYGAISTASPPRHWPR